jgi:LuxR family transcriptional activator of conjugal transfer of Ti plasmids
MFDLESLQDLKSPEEFEGLLSHQLTTLGFSNYSHMSSLNGFLNTHLINYPKEWIEHYQEQDYLYVDPTNFVGPTWTPWDAHEIRGNRQRQFFNEASDFGLHQGASISIWSRNGSRGVLSLVFDDTAEDLDGVLKSEGDYISSAGALLQDLISPNLPSYSLATREREVLKWASEGKTVPDISCILNISEAAVKRRLASARERLGAVNTASAVATAIRTGTLS